MRHHGFGPKLHSLITILAAISVSCSDDSTPDPGPADAGSNPSDSGIVPDAGEDTDAGMEMDAGDDACPGGAVVTSMSGRLQIDDGNPLDLGRAQVCVRGPAATTPACLFPQPVEADGTFQVDVPEVNQCMIIATMRAFSSAGTFAETYCDVDVTAGGALQLPSDVTVFRTQAPVDLPPEGDEDQARTVVFADDFEVDVVPAQLFGEYANLASRKWASTDDLPCFLESADTYDAVYAFSPSVNIPSRIVPDGFPFRIRNTGLTQGTMVDLFALGSLDCEKDGAEEIYEEGHWEQFGTATVDADGAISGNLPCFSWIAYSAQ